MKMSAADLEKTNCEKCVSTRPNQFSAVIKYLSAWQGVAFFSFGVGGISDPENVQRNAGKSGRPTQLVVF